MEEKSYIQHAGFVVAHEKGKLHISLLETAGCSSCHNALCLLGNTGSKQVEVRDSTSHFLVGEEVVVRINPASGYAAVAWLYMLPFALIMAVMILLLQLQYAEGIAGLLSFGVLVPYYGTLYLLRKQFRGQCKIEIAKR
ncbi:MAG: SoxR reducing system RseC family protein [Cyclobacteriaceae bacterium]|nr:SoxR reducing system RseC family protein [Cyclobacteriaceae bacterium]